MASQAAQGAPSPRTLLLFGPGAMTLDELYFNRLLSFGKSDAGSQWALHAIEDIENSWDTLCESIPRLQQTSGAKHARKLADWLRTGAVTPGTTVANAPNAILGPLVIIAQLVEYLRHVNSLSDSAFGDGRGFKVPLPSQTETVGCCLGVFSALVVSSSSSWAQFCHNAGAVLRVVFVLSALSDAQDASNVSGPSASLIAFWRGGQSVADLIKALKNYPEAYVSVLYDENRATVTTSTRIASALKSHLRTVGITANDAEFHGRFHAGQLYEDDLQHLFQFCKKLPTFQLPDASCLVLPTRINSETVIAGQENLLEVASRAFFKEQFNWIEAFRSAVSTSLRDRSSRIIEFGPERCVPPTLLRRLSSQVTHFDFESSISTLEKSGPGPTDESPLREEDVAIIGMSCNVSGAEDLGELWKILLEGKSQHQELVPNDRFVMETAFRPTEAGDERKWYGNLIRDYDAFDHKFFKRPPREVLHMDPQQRFMLQAAYQAVAQSGYYQKSGLDKRIGCYLGMVGSDYENNVSHVHPNAFSATGALRCYISGKVSHYFGWTGPGMTVDTACSASTVAIHLACQAILNGDCSAALAGGTNFCNAPMFFQNLSAGSFLSHTGQCKPFDIKADGYCRGEGIGAVFLRRLKDAVADGDQILGVIKATAINQNLNTTPIFVPNPPSLTSLFQNVLEKSGLSVRDISVVEAHGTGTPVGDPAEYGSIRKILGGSAREGLKPLQLGSLKGLIGHTEGASGVLALIKILLMMQANKIPAQASFDTINPAIKALPSDNMEISKAVIPWTDEHKAVLINNYGAAGSNASMVIKQAPELGFETSANEPPEPTTSAANSKHPIYVSGLDDKAIRAYTARLSHFIKTGALTEKPLDIENLAFNIHRQSNWSLARALVLDANSIEDLESKLTTFETFAAPAPRPVILCFGGQISKFVGLDREVFEKATILRNHLNRCDSVCKAIGVGSIYPGIFQREPINDPSVLQPLLFSLQYASASSWIDCGVDPTALVGHSFGELTALCVSGTLSLEDALVMIHGRSKIMNESWGPEKGSMMAVEADLVDVENLLLASNARLAENGGTGIANIACFNGPRSFTLAGPVAAIDAVQEIISARDATQPVLKHKRLDVTNAFHSTLVEHLKEDLEALGRKLRFQEPSIPLERATKEHETGTPSASYVAQHMRKPVHFNHAVQRLAAQYSEAIWLEAGSNSTITTMANKALGAPKASTFQAVNVTSSSQSLQQLVTTTLSLWKAGLRVTFWPHSRAQTYQYTPIILPPYQFEKHRQWLEFKPPPKQIVTEIVVSEKTDGAKVKDIPIGLFTLLEDPYQNDRQHRFRVNTTTKQYLDVVSRHVLGKTAQTCPSTFVIDVAIQAITSVQPQLTKVKKLQPQIYNVKNYSPIFAESSRVSFLEFERQGAEDEIWNLKFISQVGDGEETVHLDGQLYFQPYDDARSGLEFSRYERLVTHDRCLQVLKSDDEADDVIQGGSVYKVFADVLDYGDKFRGLQKLVGRASESAGKILRRRAGDSWLDSTLGEVFLQVGTIWTNSMSRHRRSGDDTIYLAKNIEQWTESPDVLKRLSEGSYDHDQQKEWHVLAQHKHLSHEGSFISDFFVFDAVSGALEEVILGLHYSPVSLKQLLKDTNLPAKVEPTAHEYNPSKPFFVPITPTPPKIALDEIKLHQAELPKAITKTSKTLPKRKKNTIADLWIKLQPVLADVSGLEPEEIKQTDSLAEIGIDSLMGLEMAREVETTFECSFEQSELLIIEDVPGILGLIQTTLGDGNEDTSSEASDSELSETNPSSNSTPSSVKEEMDLAESYTHPENVIDLPSTAILDAFRETNEKTDQMLKTYGCAGYLDGLSQKQTRLCLKLTSEAFKQLGCDLDAAKPGEVLQSIPFIPQHQRFHDYLYTMLEDTRIINIDGGVMTRSAIPLPTQDTDAILEDLMRRHADNGPSHQLTYNIGSRMADVLSGKTDGPQLLFGDAKNRELMASFYGELPFNKMCFEQISDFITKLATKLRLAAQSHTTLNILEMGAGTGGLTKVLLPVLAKLGVPLRYTFTDLSPSLVAQAKRKFAKYPFMEFAVHDIEKPPSDPQLIGSQHIVLASNAVHATHSLVTSSQNIHKFLQPDGFLMLVEMMEPLDWIDVVWGTLEGWWLFDDGRTHAIVNEKRWSRDLLEAGYNHVEWTHGSLTENRLQRVLIALAGDVEPRYAHGLLDSGAHSDGHHISDEANRIRKLAADEYVTNLTRTFTIPESSKFALNSINITNATCVLITGTTGSLGSHILAHLVTLPSIDTVYCLNRPKAPVKVKNGATTVNLDPLQRQIQALESRGMHLDASLLAKVKVIEADSSKPQLGMENVQYAKLLGTITHIIHNAFPVNGVRTLIQNAPQFDIMRNLIDFAADASVLRRSQADSQFRFTFQFVSSLSAVGKYPSRHSGKIRVPEELFDIDSALPNGYAGAKVVCERILNDTLNRHPDLFQAMTVRLGQLSGAMKTGYWNSMEVLAFLFKSTQTLRSLPAMPGFLTWLPIEEASASLADLLLCDAPRCYPIYHLDNPTARTWEDITPVLADALGVPQKGIVPLDEWLRRIQMYPGEDPWDNPAVKAWDFFEHKFQHMSCGGVTMFTDKAKEHSPTMRAVQPVSDELIRKFMQTWKTAGFLR